MHESLLLTSQRTKFSSVIHMNLRMPYGKTEGRPQSEAFER